MALGRFSNFFSFEGTRDFSVACAPCSAAAGSTVDDATHAWVSEEHDLSLLDNLVILAGLAGAPTSSSWMFVMVWSCSGLSEGS